MKKKKNESQQQQAILRRARQQLGVTAEGLAEGLGVSLKTVRSWLEPKTSASHRRMPATAQLLLNPFTTGTSACAAERSRRSGRSRRVAPSTRDPAACPQRAPGRAGSEQGEMQRLPEVLFLALFPGDGRLRRGLRHGGLRLHAFCLLAAHVARGAARGKSQGAEFRVAG